ncbi:MAG: DoxX family protein [Paracoccaceae bacterium]
MATSTTDAPIAAPTDALAHVAPVARVLLAAIFVFAGWNKLMDPAGSAGYIDSGGLPGWLVWPTVALELLGGLAIALGVYVRPVAAALALFSVVAGVLYHLLPGFGAEGMERMMQMIHVQKNLAIAGGLLLLTVFGPGPFALTRR